MFTDKTTKAAVARRGYCFRPHGRNGPASLPRNMFPGEPGVCKDSPRQFFLSFLIIPLLGQVGHKASRHPQAPHEILLAPLLGLSSGMEEERRSVWSLRVCFQAYMCMFMCVCVCVIVISFRMVPEWMRISLVIGPLDVSDGPSYKKRGREKRGQSPGRCACPHQSVGLCCRLTVNREASQCFCWETGSLILTLWPFSHSLVCTYIYSVRNSSYLWIWESEKWKE